MQLRAAVKNASALFLPMSFVFAICLFVGAYSSRAGENDFALTILHTNDLHSHDESFQERGHLIGGLARIGYLVHSIKANQKNVLAVDAGDFFQGTTIFQKYAGEVEVNLFNMIGYDVVTLGNHEFDNGPGVLAKELSLAKFPVINANLDFGSEEALKKIVRPSIVEKVDGQEIAFIGAVTPDLQQVALRTGSVTVIGADDKGDRDAWMKPIALQVARYKKQGINKIVLVTHCGVELDRELARAMPDVDVIVGGHSHTRLDEPIWFNHPDGDVTAVVQTGSFGRALGKFDLVFNGKGQLIQPSCNYRLINITERIKADPNMAAYISKMVAPLLPLRREIVAQAKGAFDNRFNICPWDSPLGDLVCDALSEASADYGARITFQNRGGIRGRIEPGPVSEEKVQELLPFENKLVFATIDGACLLQALEHSVDGPLGGSFLDVHGIKLGYDPQKPKGDRIVFALAEDEHGQWLPIEKSKDYKVAVNDYTFSGGEGYNFKSARNVIATNDKLSVPFHKYLLKHKLIAPQEPNRIVPVTAQLAKIEAQAGGKERLTIHSGNGAAKVEVLSAPALGVVPVAFDKESSAVSENLAHFPVPLSQALYAKVSGRCDQNGDCVLEARNDQINRFGKAHFISVIARPARSSSTKKVEISYPLAIGP